LTNPLYAREQHLGVHDEVPLTRFPNKLRVDAVPLIRCIPNQITGFLTRFGLEAATGHMSIRFGRSIFVGTFLVMDFNKEDKGAFG